MKKILPYAIVFTLLFACDDNRQYITGIYTRSATHEFGIEYDTLCIYQQTGQRYIVERRWQYIRVLDGKQLEPEYKVIRTTADDEDGKLIDERSGASYIIDGNTIYHGTIKYKRK